MRLGECICNTIPYWHEKQSIKRAMLHSTGSPLMDEEHLAMSRPKHAVPLIAKGSVPEIDEEN